MKKIIIIICAITSVAIAVSCGNQNQPKPTDTAANISEDSLKKMGEYLVNAIGCDDCHSPKVMGPQGPQVDMDKRFSGHPANMPLGPVDTISTKSWMLFNPMLTAAVGPWGISYSANITSDATGIGNWNNNFSKRSARANTKAWMVEECYCRLCHGKILPN